MKKFKLVNIILVMVISLSILLFAKETLAATDLTNTITGGNNSTTSNIQTITGNNTTNTLNTTNTTTNNAVLTTNNTSSYNNTSLPKTGIEDSVLAVILVIVLGISAVYAYKKIQDYRNI